MSTIIRTLTGRLILDTQRWARGTRKAIQDTKRMRRMAQEEVAGLQKAIARRREKMFEDLRVGINTFGVLAIGLGAGIATAFAKEASGAAARFEEQLAKFKVVFAEQADAVKQWAFEVGNAVGRSKTQMIEFLSSIQDTLVPIGFARKEAAEMSKVITQLSIDVASFNEKTDQTVLENFQSALVGSTRAVRKYGIVLSQARIEQELHRIGIQKSINEATDQEKVLARLNLIIQDTKDAHGDALRTAESFTNTMKRLDAALTNMKQRLGVDVNQAILEFIKSIGGVEAAALKVELTIERVVLALKLVWATGKTVFLSLGAIIRTVVQGVNLLWQGFMLTIDTLGAGIVEVLKTIVMAAQKTASALASVPGVTQAAWKVLNRELLATVRLLDETQDKIHGIATEDLNDVKSAASDIADSWKLVGSEAAESFASVGESSDRINTLQALIQASMDKQAAAGMNLKGELSEVDKILGEGGFKADALGRSLEKAVTMTDLMARNTGTASSNLSNMQDTINQILRTMNDPALSTFMSFVTGAPQQPRLNLQGQVIGYGRAPEETTPWWDPANRPEFTGGFATPAPGVPGGSGGGAVSVSNQQNVNVAPTFNVNGGESTRELLRTEIMPELERMVRHSVQRNYSGYGYNYSGYGYNYNRPETLQPTIPSYPY